MILARKYENILFSSLLNAELQRTLLSALRKIEAVKEK